MSDLHFGREDPVIAEGLLRDLRATHPSLLVVSGDLTQRARKAQFLAARAFLDRLPYPRIAVPGNHDVPLFDLARRLLAPLERFRRYISPEIDPVFEDEEMIVVGVSTARSNVWKRGRISWDQIDLVRRSAYQARERHVILVAHHPFAPPVDAPRTALVGRGLDALRALEACGVDLILTGHLHRGYSGGVREHYHVLDRAMITAHAPTTISHRRRGAANAYNLITLAPDWIHIEVREWNGRRFARAAHTAYARQQGTWFRAAGDPPWAEVAPPDRPRG